METLIQFIDMLIWKLWKWKIDGIEQINGKKLEKSMKNVYKMNQKLLE